MSDLVPSSDPLARLHEEFGRIAQRTATQVEGRMLEFFAARVSPSSRARWVDCLLPESVVHLALSAGSAGMSALLISPFSGECEARQLRLGTRGPLLPLRAAVRKAGGSRGLTAWCAPCGLNGSLITRVFGPSGPDIILIEEAQAATGLSGLLRPSLTAAGSLFRRFGESRILASASASSPSIRSAVARSWGLSELAAPEQHELEPQLLVSSGLQIRAASWSEHQDQGAWMERVTQLPRPAVVLCATVTEADSVYGRFVQAGLPVHRFHGALPQAERAKELLHFSLPGRRAILVAVSGFSPGTGFAGESSTAFPSDFGPGYVRQDLRSLVHMSAPSSLTQYLQELSWLAPEVGTSPPSTFPSESGSTASGFGESGPSESEEDENEDASQAARLESLPPQSLLFFSERDWVSQQQLLAKKRMAPGLLEAALDGFRGAERLSRSAWTERLMCSAPEMDRLVAFLHDAGIVRPSEARSSDAGLGKGGASPLWELAVNWEEAENRLNSLLAELELLRSSDAARLAEMQALLKGQHCRRQALTRLLSGGSLMAWNSATASQAGDLPWEKVEPPCGVCDRCESGSDVELLVNAPEDEPLEHRPPATPVREMRPRRKEGGAMQEKKAFGKSAARPSLQAVPPSRRNPPARKVDEQKPLAPASEPPRSIQDAPARPGLAKARHK